MLGEARAAPGTTRPAEGGTNTRANEQRKAYGHLWENWEGLRYFSARLDQIVAINKASAAYQAPAATATARCCGAPTRGRSRRASARTRTTSRTSTRRSRRASWTRRPCGYFITQADYDAPRTSMGPTPIQPGSVAERLAIHGITVEPWGSGVLVPLKQPMGGLVAPMLDAAGVLPMLSTAVRYYGNCDGGTVGGTVPATLSLTLGAPASLRRVHAGRRQGVRRRHGRDRHLHRR